MEVIEERSIVAELGDVTDCKTDSEKVVKKENAVLEQKNVPLVSYLTIFLWYFLYLIL